MLLILVLCVLSLDFGSGVEGMLCTLMEFSFIMYNYKRKKKFRMFIGVDWKFYYEEKQLEQTEYGFKCYYIQITVMQGTDFKSHTPLNVCACT